MIGHSSKPVKRHGSLDSMNGHRNPSFHNNTSPMKLKNEKIEKNEKYDPNRNFNNFSKIKNDKNSRNFNNRCYSEPISLNVNNYEDDLLLADSLYNQLLSKIKIHSEVCKCIFMYIIMYMQPPPLYGYHQLNEYFL